MIKLALLRHGQSTWNLSNRFTGWTDVPLTPLGKKEASRAGVDLRKKGFVFDVVFTSEMRRAKQSTALALKAMRHPPVRIVRDWRLNERHYGALQGLNKAEMAKKFGEKQVLIWRRSYNVLPPALKTADKRFISQLRTYPHVPRRSQPRTECLKDTITRVIPLWRSEIAPRLRKGERVLISAHHNTLRGLVKHLDGLSPKEILGFNIPTGIPLIYELDDKLRPIRHYYLGDADALQAAIDKVKSQGKSR